METTETEWGPWIEWNGGECPIPEADWSGYAVRYRAGPEANSFCDPTSIWWGREACPAGYEIVAYRLKAADPIEAVYFPKKTGAAFNCQPAPADDWKADMLAAWEAGELEYTYGEWDGYLWTDLPRAVKPTFLLPREHYRRRPSAEKPQEPADPNAAMIARDGEPTSPKYAEYVEVPAGQAKFGSTTPTGLTTCAAFTHKLGGWGL